MVSVSTCINHKVLVPNCQPDGESVGVAMCSGARVPERPEIHKQTNRSVIGANASKAALSKQFARSLGTFRKTIECTDKVRNECLGCSGRLGAKTQPCGFIKQEPSQLGGDFQGAFV